MDKRSIENFDRCIRFPDIQRGRAFDEVIVAAVAERYRTGELSPDYYAGCLLIVVTCMHVMVDLLTMMCDYVTVTCKTEVFVFLAATARGDRSIAL